MVGASVSLILLPASWESFALYWVTLSSLDMWAFAVSYCTLFCSVWLLSLGDLLLSFGDLLFSEKEIDRGWIWGRGNVCWRGGELREMEGKKQTTKKNL